VEIDLATYARISADIAEGDVPVSAILEREKLTDAEWTAVTVRWSQRMAEPGQAGFALEFSDAFAAAQDAKKALPKLGVEDWARLVTAMEEDTRGPVPALRAQGLGLADHARLVRHWAKRLASDPALARAYDAARAGL